MKKLAGLVGAGALILALAGPVLASNVAIIKGNDATADANTGWNVQFNGTSVYKAGVDGNVTNSGDNTLTTGNAKAKAKVWIVANTDVDGGGSGGLAVVKWNDAAATADSGVNMQGNGTSVEKAHVDGSVGNSGNNTLTTGKAKAEAKAWIVVNSSWSGW